MKMICPICNKEFYVPRGLMGEYVYKKYNPNKDSKSKVTYYCSYKCWRTIKGELKNEDTKNENT